MKQKEQRAHLHVVPFVQFSLSAGEVVREGRLLSCPSYYNPYTWVEKGREGW
jgi:hypothetical protein